LPAEHPLTGNDAKITVPRLEALVNLSQLYVEALRRRAGALLPWDNDALALTVLPWWRLRLPGTGARARIVSSARRLLWPGPVSTPLAADK
jgi:hypothetical protein